MTTPINEQMTTQTNEQMSKEGLDTSNVLDWSARPRRAAKRRALTYWEEYVETDDWYLDKLVEDVPADEMHAALHDDNFEEDEGEDGDDDDEECDESTDDSFVEQCETSADDDYEYEEAASDSDATVDSIESASSLESEQ